MQVNFNSLAQCSNTRALAHACCLAQLGLAQPMWAELGPAPKKIKKNKK
jgi:hypothetical protein